MVESSLRQLWRQHPCSYIQIQPKTHTSLHTFLCNQPRLAKRKRENLHNVYGGLVRHFEKELDKL
jgi:hypothetical protein